MKNRLTPLGMPIYYVYIMKDSLFLRKQKKSSLSALRPLLPGTATISRRTPRHQRPSVLPAPSLRGAWFLCRFLHVFTALFFASFSNVVFHFKRVKICQNDSSINVGLWPEDSQGEVVWETSVFVVIFAQHILWRKMNHDDSTGSCY